MTIAAVLTPLALEKTNWSKRGEIKKQHFVGEIYEEYQGKFDFVCSAEVITEKDEIVGVITAKHCITPGRYEVRTHTNKRLVVDGDAFVHLTSDIVYLPVKPNWKPKFGKVNPKKPLVIYHSALGKPVKLQGEVLFVGKVGDLRIPVHWLDPEDTITLVKAIGFGGMSGSPVYQGNTRVGVMSGSGAGMSIIITPSGVK